MSEDLTISELLTIINERDKHTQDKLIDMLATQKETEKTIKKVCEHIIVSEEQRKQDSEHRKRVNDHIKFAEPILYKSKDAQESRGKIFIVAAGFIVTAILGALFSFK